MNGHAAYAAFLKSEQLAKHLVTHTGIDLALFTLSWFLLNKPIQVKFPPRNTSKPTHCQQATQLGGDGKKGE